MKKNLLFLLLAFIAVNFMACKDEEALPIDEKIAGVYKGTLDIELDGTTIAQGFPKNVTITNAGGDKVNMGLKEFNFGGMNLGDITLENCELVEQNGSYVFSGSQELELPKPVGTCGAKVNGTITDGKATIHLDIDVPLLGQTVKVVYTGTKLAGTESSEAKILSFVFDRNVAAVDSLVVGTPVINEEAKAITFLVADTTAEYLAILVPTIEISEKASISPASGVAQDFNKPVKYTVMAEDGTVVEYTVSIDMCDYGFENWVAGVEGQTEENTFYEPFGWSSSNTGAHFLKNISTDFANPDAPKYADSYVVMPTEDAHSGESAALIKTIDTKGGNVMVAIPKVTTGSLFLGSFETDIWNTLNSTKFGVPYAKKPQALKGWYKYTPGETFYVCEAPYDKNCDKATADASKKDEFMISVVLYETEEYDVKKWTDCLTGVADVENNIYASSRIAAIAQLTGGAQADWKSFELPLEWKREYDATKKYRMTVACSSSKDGDKFWGAPGSTLIVDDFELVVE